MRLHGTLMSLAVGLWLTGAASAQFTLFPSSGSSSQSSFFPVIGQTQNVVVDTRNALQPIAQPMYVQNSWTRMTNFFPQGVGKLPAKPSAGGASAFPTPSQMPGANYLQPFGFYRGSQATSHGRSWWPF